MNESDWKAIALNYKLEIERLEGLVRAYKKLSEQRQEQIHKNPWSSSDDGETWIFTAPEDGKYHFHSAQGSFTKVNAMSENENPWISVDDEMPPLKEWIRVWTEHYTGCPEERHNSWRGDHWYMGDEKITHWQRIVGPKKSTSPIMVEAPSEGNMISWEIDPVLTPRIDPSGKLASSCNYKIVWWNNTKDHRLWYWNNEKWNRAL